MHTANDVNMERNPRVQPFPTSHHPLPLLACPPPSARSVAV